ncbi:hypothetical protein ACHAWF_010142 [Thalassiosira exigua]
MTIPNSLRLFKCGYSYDATAPSTRPRKMPSFRPAPGSPDSSTRRRSPGTHASQKANILIPDLIEPDGVLPVQADTGSGVARLVRLSKDSPDRAIHRCVLPSKLALERQEEVEVRAAAVVRRGLIKPVSLAPLPDPAPDRVDGFVPLVCRGPHREHHLGLRILHGQLHGEDLRRMVHRAAVAAEHVVPRPLPLGLAPGVSELRPGVDVAALVRVPHAPRHAEHLPHVVGRTEPQVVQGRPERVGPGPAQARPDHQEGLGRGEAEEEERGGGVSEEAEVEVATVRAVRAHQVTMFLFSCVE